MQSANSRPSPARTAALLYLGLAAVLFAAILVRTGGHFTYCLDDPYIHLALAERLRHGLYGLNTGEPTSPSSSILWPLLFVPFAATALLPWLPLVVNLICGTAAAALLGNLVTECFAPRTFSSRTISADALVAQSEASAASPTAAAGTPLPPPTTQHAWRMPLLAALLVLGLNLLGLTYTGMEHPLQLLLSIACALGAIRAMHGERIPPWTIAAAVLLPSVRYEGLLLTVGLACALVGVRAWKTAAATLAASAVVPATFSLFLHRLGLPWFPLSVLVKSSYKFQDESSFPVRTARLIFQTVRASLFDLERLPELILTILLATLAWRHRRTRSLRYALGGGAFVGAVQVVLGPVGWFYRYELYALAYTLLLLLAALALSRTAHMTESGLGSRSRGNLDVTSPTLRTSALHPPPAVPVALLLGVGALALIYLRPLVSVPRAALGIYQQQYQLGRLASEFYHAPIAINDLGWVAFRRTPDQYVLDLYGLGSYETFRTRQQDRTPAWLDGITREHNVGLVAIYPEWFPQGVPATWTPVAKLCAADVDTTLGPVSQRVMFYQTHAADPSTLHNALRQLQNTLPPHVTLDTNPHDTSNHCE